MSSASRPRRARAVAAVALAALLTACSGGSEGADSAASPTSTPSPTASATPPPPPPVDPLLGVAPQPTTPLVAVKVDNAPLARPFHTGLDGASVLYLELVEGGATRFLALYSRPYDQEVGPIRSFRESDLELLAQYGKPVVAASGANRGVLASLAAAARAGQVVDAVYDTRKGLYRIGERRRDAKNFYAVPSKLAQAGAGAPASDVGWTFAAAKPAAGAPATSARVVFSDRSAVRLEYVPSAGRYRLKQDGRYLPGFSAANVLVQSVRIKASRYRDVTGAMTPYVETLGSGQLHVLRDGVRVSGTWSRKGRAFGTQLLDSAGRAIPLRPGPTLVLLQPAGLPFGAS